MAAAVMSITQIPGTGFESGRVRVKQVEITFTAAGDTYVTGGFAVDPRGIGLLEVLGLKEIAFALANGAAQTGAWLVKYDNRTGKLQLFTAAAAPGATVALVEAANTVVVGTFVIRAELTGRV